MNREERVCAVLEGKEPDRIPVSVWMHQSDVDQDPRSLAERLSEFNEKYDYDFIKMMPFGAYTVPDWGAKLSIYCDRFKEVEIAAPGVGEADDYLRIEPLPAVYGTWGKTLQLTQHLSRLVAPHTPYMQTLFTPATTLKKLVGTERLAKDMREHPEYVHQALAAITETTINFVKANIEAGVSGFFLATQCATYDFLDDTLFAEFCKPYDIQVINSYRDVTWFNVLHIHGGNIMFNATKDYPCNVINWHDRYTSPSLKEARAMTNKVFLGGLREVPTIVGSTLHYDSILATDSPDQIRTHVQEAIDMVGGHGLLIGPGCVADPHAPEENLHAVRKAVER
ncbi:uroporphyrinogen decarboxylase family protein [Oscillibacter sp.]|uniref:uroporphyrinogen decarboxylase family protein n=1 Tax=Oscillibacter sp. TaxID=1945593 RepID=UPI003394DF00